MSDRPTRAQRLVQTLTGHLDQLTVEAPMLLPLHVKPVSSGIPVTDSVTVADRHLSMLHEVTMVLNAWARIVVEDRGTTHGVPLGTDTVGLCRFLARHAIWLGEHAAAQDCCDEIGEWTRKVHAIVQPPDPRGWISLGPCPYVVASTDDDGVTTEEMCDGTIRGWTDGRDPDCSDCGHSDEIARWQEVLPSVPTRVTSSELADIVRREFGRPAKSNAVNVWVNRGWIAPIACQLGTRASIFQTEAALYELAWHFDRRRAS